MTLLTTQEADAYDAAHKRDMAAGKAKPIDYTKCLCGYNTYRVPQQDGRSWICGDPQCDKKSRFEKFNK